MGQLEEGAELVKELRHKNVDVSDAYWLYDSGEGRWSLHLIVPDLGTRDIHKTYMALGETIRERGKRLLDGKNLAIAPIEPPVIRLEDLNDRIAKAVDSFAKKHGPNLATTVRRSFVEGQHVDDMYIYRRDMRLK